AANNPVAGVAVTFTAPVSGASAVCSPSNPTTDANGVASTTCSANDVTGSYVVSAGIGALVPADFALTNTGLPASIVAVAGTPQSALVGTLFAVPLQVKVTDAMNAPVPAATVTFSVPANGAGAICAPTSAQTDANGFAQTSCTADTVAGSYA